VTDLSDAVRQGRGHLDDEVISALLDDELPTVVRDQADRHRSGCARCRQRSDELGRAAMSVAALAVPGSALTGSALTGSALPDPAGAAGHRSRADLAVAAVLRACADAPASGPFTLGEARSSGTDTGTVRGLRPNPRAGSLRRRTRGAGVLVGVAAVVGAGLAVGGLHSGADPAGPPRSVILASSLGSFSSPTSLRSTLEATVASIDATGPAGAPGGTESVPCHQEAARTAELAAATAAVPAASAVAGPEANFAAPVELSGVPAEVFTFPRLSVAGAAGTVTRVGTYAVVVEDGTCAVVARLGW
jgi:hypothetical protein